MPRPSAVVFAMLLAVEPAVAEIDPWEAAYDPATRTRFIPLQLIIGGRWDGARTITYPQGRFGEGVERGSIWSGPVDWTHPKTGEALVVYHRSRQGRNAADQTFAVRKDGVAIGRVADSRFGIDACAEEAKYPLGVWRQGETRSFDYTCWYGGKARRKRSTITIREIDFDCGGRKHCLEVEWILRDQGDERQVDRKTYVFAPEKGVIAVR